MRRRRPPPVVDVDSQRLLSYRAEEWASEAEWRAAREAWHDAGGAPLTRPEDVERAAAWDWHTCMDMYADPEEWRAALHAWEDRHGRLTIGPTAPLEPNGRGMYDHRTGRWSRSL